MGFVLDPLSYMYYISSLVWVGKTVSIIIALVLVLLGW